MARSTRADGSASGPAAWLRGLWAYYREYTHTALHTAAAAALTAFGLLVFVDPLFVVLAIGAYVCPPVVLYVLDAEVGKPNGASASTGNGHAAGDRSGAAPRASDGDADADNGDSDSDSDDGDTDSDS